MRKHDIEYLRVVLTNNCNLSCSGCHKEGQEKHVEIPSEKLIRIISCCINAGIKKVKFIGGEPTLRKDCLDLIIYIKEKYPYVDLSMISNGLADIDFYKKCLSSGLNRLNISVHGWNKEYFISNTNSHEKYWRTMKNNLTKLLSEELVNKVNYVIKKGVNEEDLFSLIDWISQFRGVRLDILNYLCLTSDVNANSYKYSMKEIESLLQMKYGILVKSDFKNPYSIDSENLLLSNRLNINLKTHELKDFQYMNACESCTIKNICTEGIAAMRLTTDMKLQPCLLRNDNSLQLPRDIADYTDLVKKFFLKV